MTAKRKFYAPIYLDDLSEFYGKPVEELMNESYRTLIELTEGMKKKKAADTKARNAQDEEFARIVKKYFTPFKFLTRFWTESDIIYAVSQHCTLRDLVMEYPVRAGYGNPGENAEFIRQSYENLPRYTKSGERLMEGENVKCDVYRVKNKYQGIRHGDVILDLLYHSYPELQEFQFSAYEFYSYEDPEQYEIYPKNQIYTPLVALLTQNIEVIRKRNLEYGSSYNYGSYTPSAVQKRMESEEGQHYFDVIHHLKPHDPSVSVFC